MAKKKRRKPRKCRICKKSPVWKGGDVKDPGPFCKKCYHKKISPGRNRTKTPAEDTAPVAVDLDWASHGVDNGAGDVDWPGTRGYLGTDGTYWIDSDDELELDFIEESETGDTSRSDFRAPPQDDVVIPF